VKRLVLSLLVCLTLGSPALNYAGPPERPTSAQFSRNERARKSALRPSFGQLRSAARAKANVRALARGTLVDGPKHTWKAILQNPKLFIGGLLAIGVVATVSHYLGFNAEPYLLAASGTALAFQVKQSWGKMKASRGTKRWRLVGENVVWPAALVGVTAVAGHHAGHAPTHAPSLVSSVRAFVQAILIGGDAPGVVVTGLNQKP
jgi:hypothetical protein